MTYKVNDLVYFRTYNKKGVGRIIATDEGSYQEYLVHSTQIENGNGGGGKHHQDNQYNWWFTEAQLKPFTKKEGQQYKVIRDSNHNFKVGDIATLTNLYEDGMSIYKTEDEEWFLFDIDHPNCEVEFYADIEDAERAKENEVFTKEDLKVGYLVKDKDDEFAHIVYTREEGLCLNYEDGYEPLSNYSSDLTHKTHSDCDVVEVYGLTARGYNAHKFEVGGRKLLRGREEATEMTIEDIQKALGYKIKVVE